MMAAPYSSYVLSRSRTRRQPTGEVNVCVFSLAFRTVPIIIEPTLGTFVLFGEKLMRALGTTLILTPRFATLGTFKKRHADVTMEMIT